jgi:hypothetical protein
MVAFTASAFVVFSGPCVGLVFAGFTADFPVLAEIGALGAAGFSAAPASDCARV